MSNQQIRHQDTLGFSNRSNVRNGDRSWSSEPTIHQEQEGYVVNVSPSQEPVRLQQEIRLPTNNSNDDDDVIISSSREFEEARARRARSNLGRTHERNATDALDLGYYPVSPAFLSSPESTSEPEGYTPVSPAFISSPESSYEPEYAPMSPFELSSPREVSSDTVTREPEGYTPVSPAFLSSPESSYEPEYAPMSPLELSSPREVSSDTVTREPEIRRALVSPNEQTKRRRVSLEGSSKSVLQTQMGQDLTMPLHAPKEPTVNCPVCVSPLADPMSTRCGHIFCKRCLERSLDVQEKCPICRTTISMRDCINIFLPAISK